ncbi:hypothetical protein [Nitrosophilus kaiyonis]|uniref:hypothetical protein n=1 Tax=Nitrosophilus kaiyonis TaxID=2930200 RepID=UPI00249134DC|nr:hypothetical protein [Nitrosophilus kaiyonis]
MNKIFSIIKFFSKSLFKEKATILFVILAVVMIVIAFGLSDIDIARKYKLLEDVLLTSQMFLLHIAALFYSFEFLQKERSLGLFVLPLSTGLSRQYYLISVFLTLLFMVFSIFLSFFVIDTILLWILEKKFVFEVLWQLFLYSLSSIVLSFLIIMFSNFVSLMNSIIYSVALFFIGNGLDEFYIYSHYIKKEKILENLSSFFYYIFPNFSIFDKQAIVVNRGYIDFGDFFVYPVIYFSILSLIIFSITLLKYKKRVLRFGE